MAMLTRISILQHSPSNDWPTSELHFGLPTAATLQCDRHKHGADLNIQIASAAQLLHTQVLDNSVRRRICD